MRAEMGREDEARQAAGARAPLNLSQSVVNAQMSYTYHTHT